MLMKTLVEVAKNLEVVCLPLRIYLIPDLVSRTNILRLRVIRES